VDAAKSSAIVDAWHVGSFSKSVNLPQTQHGLKRIEFTRNRRIRDCRVVGRTGGLLPNVHYRKAAAHERQQLARSSCSAMLTACHKADIDS
jgi:hypothetical protein